LSLHKESKQAFWQSFGLVNLFWWHLLWRTGNRILFVIENGGMERVDGFGSPLAFVIGVLGEQLFFIPLSFSIVLGLLSMKSFTKSQQPTAKAAD
jgi:hypothetical protein